jgi:preprotein translocase subunit SecF
MIKIIQKRKIWFSLSIVLIILSILSLIFWGLPLSIDFKGGSLLEIGFEDERPSTGEIKQTLNDLGLGEIQVQPTGEQDMILRMSIATEDDHQRVIEKINQTYQGVEEKRFESVGPIIGSELKQKAIYALIVAAICIILYIAWAFRRVSKPVASWKFGIVAIIALAHDILITLGVISIIAHFSTGIEIGVAFIAALLTILGYSVNDTIVVFDRTRENLLKHYGEDFEETVNMSVNQTITRSVNTSITTLLALLAIYIFGGESIKYFALTLIVGIISGTYSSIFLASPLVVTWEKMRNK